ncbi:hypothetical protein PR048_002130 [Dryococelus australis]|uniref:Uncharacterized protein n=1 Tax=Dryococelus australis TaxID=614101 RepID=A0ABQ9IKU3_9NEOP|nr:hypothetical protein PR048_002130 [Dryococelus australis]
MISPIPRSASESTDSSDDNDERVNANDGMSVVDSVCVKFTLTRILHEVDELQNKHSSALNTDDDYVTPTKRSKRDIEDDRGSEDDHEESIDDRDYDNSVDGVSDENDDESRNVPTKAPGGKGVRAGWWVYGLCGCCGGGWGERSCYGKYMLREVERQGMGGGGMGPELRLSCGSSDLWNFLHFFDMIGSRCRYHRACNVLFIDRAGASSRYQLLPARFFKYLYRYPSCSQHCDVDTHRRHMALFLHYGPPRLQADPFRHYNYVINNTIEIYAFSLGRAMQGNLELAPRMARRGWGPGATRDCEQPMDEYAAAETCTRGGSNRESLTQRADSAAGQTADSKFKEKFLEFAGCSLNSRNLHYLINNLLRIICGHGGRAVSSLASHQGDPGSIPGRVIGFSHVGMPLVGGSSRGSPVSPAHSFRRCSMLTSIALIGSQCLDIWNYFPSIVNNLTVHMLVSAEWSSAGMKGQGKRENSRENPPTSNIVRQDFHMQTSESGPSSPWWSNLEDQECFCREVGGRPPVKPRPRWKDNIASCKTRYMTIQTRKGGGFGELQPHTPENVFTGQQDGGMSLANQHLETNLPGGRPTNKVSSAPHNSQSDIRTAWRDPVSSDKNSYSNVEPDCAVVAVNIRGAFGCVPAYGEGFRVRVPSTVWTGLLW